MKKALKIFLILVTVLTIAYLAGPKFPKPHFNNSLPALQVATADLDNYIKDKESRIKLKPDNQSRIVWANDSLKNKTEWCLLYLHGFAASWYEGEPVHRNFAKRYGMNLYIPRLAAHGIDTTEALIDMTPERLYESAKEALVVAQSVGEKVILMGTSTGATLSLKLASEYPELMEALILLSPNIELNNPAAFLLSKPWGLQIGRLASNGKYRITNSDFAAEECKYWNCKQRMESLVYLQQLLEATMTKETFSKVEDPVFLAYYYKDEEHQDPTVRVDAMLKMFDQLKTPAPQKLKQAFPEAGTHVIGCKLFSGAWKEVELASYQFAEKKLGLVPLQN